MQFTLDDEPRFPRGKRSGIGIIGCGHIVQTAHLPAYEKYGLNIVGVYDISEQAMRTVQQRFHVRHAFASVDDLFASSDIEVVDIATHPAERAGLILKALQAGKHVLSQKPFALDMHTAQELIQEAERRHLTLAVNQNGRWAPPWRITTQLVQQGAIGEVLAVTHLFDTRFEWVTGTVFDTIPHWAIYDYGLHWIDSIHCWLADTPLTSIRAREYRTPDQPMESKADWGMWCEFVYANGAHAMIRSVGCSQTQRDGHPFWLHGTQGIIRGSILGKGNDFVELERDGISSRYPLKGQWFPDGFAGTMGELLCAIEEDREPYHSARHTLRSLQMTLAACQSAEHNGEVVPYEEMKR
ncbi:Gfo/Idh/MocA family protein [Ktedonospora formicarum]|uniref:NADH-dependent dehydrogenase n=1 Tax=Ktedonospora formicarum TaxID=2778364 RepID=A0A8J3I7V2_9CHLR|nr:Gfo/Idh/MocA family oxidoreductase [Ktedonospora formicarum]GHO47418.1 NADH-dependent dehydrogenase [Ktedonospora formicarum]